MRGLLFRKNLQNVDISRKWSIFVHLPSMPGTSCQQSLETNKIQPNICKYDIIQIFVIFVNHLLIGMHFRIPLG